MKSRYLVQAIFATSLMANNIFKQLCSRLRLADRAGDIKHGPPDSCTEPNAADETLSDQSTVLNVAHDAILMRDTHGKIVFWNKSAEETYGWLKKDALGKIADELLEISLSCPADQVLSTLYDVGQWEGEATHRTIHGQLIVVNSRRVLQFSRSGAPIGIIEINRDITELKDNEQKLRAGANLLQAVMDSTSSYIHIRDRQGRFLYVNKEYEKVFGVTKDEVIGNTIEDVFEPKVAKIRREMHETVVKSGVDLHAEILQLQADGVHTYLDVKSPLFDETGKLHAVYCLGTDITERKLNEEKMLHLAHYDVTTNLPNRAMFYDRLDESIKRTNRNRSAMALLFLDLDGFKEINDSLGHDYGDLLLVEASQRICSCVRESDTVARMGGDEFIVILDDLREFKYAERVASNILENLSRPYPLGEEQAYISASMGITVYPEDAATASALLKNADLAMYMSKLDGGNRYNFFDPKMREAAETRTRMNGDLRVALSQKQFSLAYQPIIELASGAVLKAEALIRWHHPTNGLISPADFIPVTEDSGMIIPIGDWVFREAAMQVKSLRAQHDENFQLSINTSPIQYKNSGIDLAGWKEYLNKLDLPGTSMVIEITEGLLMDATASITEQLLYFRELGIQISLDDFGTGYSSLSYLKKFDMDYLKIDRSFVSNLQPDSNDMALCEAIIVMAHKLGIKVIAEGIETMTQRDLLANAGCDYGQGYLFSPPLDSKRFSEYLQTKHSPLTKSLSQ